MVALVEALRLAAYALGAVGSVLTFVEFFQLPSYISYDTNIQSWEVHRAPNEVQEHTWFGRTGGLMLALAFALLFVAELL